MPQKRTRRRSERRIRPRAEARLSMRVEGAHEAEQAHIVTESQNISSSGVYCTSSRYLAPLSKVALTIVLPAVPGRAPSQRLLKCEGVVVRCQASDGPKKDRAYQLACSFLGFESSARDRLEEYVVWRNLQALRIRSRTAAPRRTATRRGAAAAASRGASATRTTAAGRTGVRKRRTVH